VQPTNGQLRRAGLAGVLLAVVTIAAGYARAARDEKLAPFLSRIQSDNADVRYAAWSRADRIGAPAVVPLGKLLASEDREVAKAAAEALKVIVHHAGRPGAGQARRSVAAELVKLLAPHWPARTRAEAIHLLSFVAGAGQVPAIAGLLADADLREEARLCLERLPTEAATRALIDALDDVPDAFKPRIIEALGHRRSREAVAALCALAKGQDKSLAEEALAALARIGPQPGSEALLAPEALAKLPDADLERLADAFLRFADRCAAEGEPRTALAIYRVVLERAKAEHLRCAALIGLGSAGPAGVDVLLASLADASIVIRRAAVESLVSMRGTGINEALVKTFKTGPVGTRAKVLRILAARKAPQADALIRQACKDPVAELRVTAFDLLGRLEDPKLVPTLLEAARTGSGRTKTLALSAYLNIARARLEAGQRDEALAMYHKALPLASEPDTLAEVLRGIGAIGSPESAASVRGLLSSPASDEACRAYMAIAAGLAAAGQKDKAVAMLAEVVGHSSSGRILKSAVGELKKLGADLRSLARQAGFITDWWLIGPFPNPNKTAYRTVYFPEKQVVLDRGGEVAGKRLRWKRFCTEQVPAVIDLTAQFDPHEHVAAYAYAEITSPRPRRVKIKIGSDDGVVVWLNGRRIHGTNADRGLHVDEDVIPAELRAGKNALLVKVLQGGGGWQLCVRITDPQDNPLDLAGAGP